MPYEKIILQGKGYISTEALSLFSQNNRNVILLDNHGKPITFCHSMMDSLTATKYRMAQYDTFRNPEKCEYLRRQIIYAKQQSQLKLLKFIGSKITELPEKGNPSAQIFCNPDVIPNVQLTVFFDSSFKVFNLDFSFNSFKSERLI